MAKRFLDCNPLDQYDEMWKGSRVNILGIVEVAEAPRLGELKAHFASARICSLPLRKTLLLFGVFGALCL